MLAPRRILTFLVLTGVLTATGVAAVGFGVESTDLPAEFHPAQPRVGDKAEWAYSLLHANGTQSKNALPALRLEMLPETWIVDANGQPARVQQRLIGQTGYWSYAHSHDVADFEWVDVIASMDARGIVHRRWSGDPETTFDASGYQGLPLGTESSTIGGWADVFPNEPEPALLTDCLAQPLPADLDLGQPIRMPACRLEGRDIDPDRFPYTGYELAERDDLVHTFVETGGRLTAIGSAQTVWGDAVVFDMDGSRSARRLWFVDTIPFPVQTMLETPRGHILYTLTRFARDAAPADGPGAALVQVPPIESAPIQPWGPDEAGVHLPLMPSEAWRFALEEDPENRLAGFLAAHPNAYTEAALGAPIIGSSASYLWEFQLRSNNDRLTLRVEKGSFPISYPVTDPLWPSLPWPMTIEDGFEQPYDMAPPNGPMEVPTLASAAARLHAMTGETATSFVYRWDCNDSPATCVEGSGPVVDAVAIRLGSDGSPAATAGLTGAVRNATRWTLQSDPAGRIDALYFWRSDHTTEPGITQPESRADIAAVPAPPASRWSSPSPATVATIGAAAGLLGLLYLLWPAIKNGAAMLLFSRTRDDTLLELPARRAVMDAIEAQPGIHLQALARMTGQGKSTLEHHLRKMVAARLVVAAPGNGYTSFFPAGTDARVAAAGPVLRAPSARQVLQAIVAHPGANGGRIAELVGLNRGTVLHHVKRLQSAGLISREQEAGVSRLFATDLADKSLAAA